MVLGIPRLRKSLIDLSGICQGLAVFFNPGIHISDLLDLTSLRPSIHRCWKITLGEWSWGVHHQLSCMHLLSVLSLQDWRLLKTNLFRMNLGGSLLFPPALSTFAFLNSGVKIKGIDGYKLVRKANGEPPRVLACQGQGWPDLLFGLPAVLHVEVLAPVLLECSQMMQERVGIDTCGILWPLDAKLKSQLWTCYAISLHIYYI